jgi:hypothetical protein
LPDAALVITFFWGDDGEDGTIHLVPLDARRVELDMSDAVAVTTFLSQQLEFTLGGPRESWERARTTPLSARLSVVRPYTSD